MVIKPIKSQTDHDEALREIQRLWGTRAGTPNGDRLDVWMTLVKAYERVHYPIDPPDPIDAIRFRLEQQGLDPRALIGIIGNRTRVYEVLRGDRALSIAVIRRLHERFGILADVLIQRTAKKSAAGLPNPPA